MVDYADILLAGDEPQQQPFDVNKLAPEQRAAYERMMNGKPKQVPQAQPQPAPQMQAPAARPQVDYADELLGGTAPQMAQPKPQQQKEGWGEWLGNMVRGKQDPREQGTRTVFEQFPGELRNPTANAAIMGASDEAMGDIITQNLGGNFVRREKDANGYEVIVTRGPDGQEQRGYVNAPGLDTQDVSRAIYGTLPYSVSGGATGVLMKGAGVGAQAIGQGLAAIGTSLFGDAGTIAQGSEQGFDPGKAATMGFFGMAGPPVSAAGGALWRRFVTIPGLIDKTTGKLTAKGMEYARKAGLEAEDLAPDAAQTFAKTFAETGDPAQAAIVTGTERFGIPATRGQMTKDPYLLTQEEGMRRRLFGQGAQDTMRGFDQRQADAVRSAALGSPVENGGRSVGRTIAPDRATGTPPVAGDIGGNIQGSLINARGAAKAAESKAWEGAKGLEVTDEALATLPDALNKSLGGRQINETLMPAASAMAKEVDRIISGTAPAKAAGWVKNDPTRNVDQMRRSLLSLYKSAGTSEDQAAARAIYDGFNDWITEAAKANLLKGEPEAALQLVKARGFTKEVRELFAPSAADGRMSPAGARLSKIIDPAKTDSGDSVINALFGSQGSNAPQAGTVQALQSIKTVLQKYTPDQAKSAWDDIRFAYWSRLVTSKTGDMLGPQAIASNIKTAMQSKDGVMRVLFDGKEAAEIRSFLRAMEAIAYKPPNASGSGYTAASFAKDALLKVLDSFGLGKAGGAALNYTGIGNAWNAAGARQAVNQSIRPLRPNLTPAVTGAGQAYNQSGDR